MSELRSPSSPVEARALSEFRDRAVRDAGDYFSLSNSIFGVVAFGFALACLSLPASKGYAFASTFFLAALWGAEMQRYKTRLSALNAIPKTALRPIYVIRRCALAIFGWTFLAMVAVGMLTPAGLVL